MKQNDIAKVLSVSGMTCPNCELRIEHKVKTLPGIISVKANYTEESVTLIYDSSNIKETEIVTAIVTAIESMDYKVKAAGELSAELHNTKAVDKKLWIAKLLGIAVAIVVILLVLNNAVEFDLSTINPKMGYGILFIVGLVTSLHCIAMCGGINLSTCMSYKVKNSDRFSKLFPSILYNTGRVISYTLVGGIVGALGSVININQIAGVRGIGTLVAGSFMVLMGLNMMGIFPALRKLIPKMPKIFGNKLYAGIGKSSPFMIGLLNGLMPCGPMQSIQLYALGTGSFLSGALSMFLFSLGTVPAMFGFGAVSSMLSMEFTAKMMKVSAILIMVLGIGMLAMGLRSSLS